MLKLDNTLLEELGLGALPEDQKRSMLEHIYETLELRVGTDLANQMTDQQLQEFERFIDDGGDANQAQALQWLEANLPNYKQVVNDVFEALKVEIKQMAPQLLAASQAQAAAMPAPAQSQQRDDAAPYGNPQQASAGYPPQPVQQSYSDPQPTQPVQDSFRETQPSQPMQSPYGPSTVPQQLAPDPQWSQPTQPQPAQPTQPGQPQIDFPTQQPPAGPGAPQSPQY